MNFAKNYEIITAQLISESRIIMAADMNDWWNYLKENNFNYSFGSRIHGTIMALLSGVPATIVTMDSRTREMAEFFSIPHVMGHKKYCFEKDELYKIYDEMNYSMFNKSFTKKFLEYEKFLKEHGIVSHVNENNTFFMSKKSNVHKGLEENRENFEQFAKKMNTNKHIIRCGNILRSVIREIRLE